MSNFGFDKYILDDRNIRKSAAAISHTCTTSSSAVFVTFWWLRFYRLEKVTACRYIRTYTISYKSLLYVLRFHLHFVLKIKTLKEKKDKIQWDQNYPGTVKKSVKYCRQIHHKERLIVNVCNRSFKIHFFRVFFLSKTLTVKIVPDPGLHSFCRNTSFCGVGTWQFSTCLK